LKFVENRPPRLNSAVEVGRTSRTGGKKRVRGNARISGWANGGANRLWTEKDGYVA